MSTLSFKIAYPIVIAGFFVIVSVIALNYNSLNASFYIILSFLTVYLFLFGFATGQNFAAPVKRLLKKADDLSRGDLKSRFYSESNTENEKIEKSVGIKVEAETQSLNDIINALEQKVQNRTLEVQKMVRDLEKFKEYSGEKEADSIVLKNQILELKEKLEKHGDKKTKIKNEGEESGKTEKPEKIENEKTDEKS